MASNSILWKVGKIAIGAAVAWQLSKVVSALSQEQHTQLVSSKRRRPKPSGIFKDRFIQNAQGLWLFKRCWEPATTPIGSVFLVHGFAEHCGRYDHVATTLNKMGLVVWALDHQGHGQSEGDSAHVQKFQHYMDDYIQFVRATLDEEPHLQHLPKFLLGHSMGGLIAAHVALQSSHLWTGVILSGPGIKIDPKAASPALLATARFLSKVLPKLPVQKLDSAGVCSDPLVVEQYKTDPLVYTGGMRARWGAEIMVAMETLNKAVGTFKLPLLLVHGEADPICNVDGSKEFMERAASEDKQIIVYSGMRHEIFNEPDHERVLADVCNWLKDRLTV